MSARTRPRHVQLDLLGPVLEPTRAMLAGTQHVWQHSECGTVVVIPSSGKPGLCPSSTCGKPEASWWAQTLPVAGLASSDGAAA